MAMQCVAVRRISGVRIGNRRSRRAFTLIELLVTVVVVGVLSSVALPNFLNFTERARYTEAASDLGKHKTSLVAFRQESGVFPGDRNIAAAPIGLENDWKTRGPFNSPYDYDSYANGSGCYVQVVFFGRNGLRDAAANAVLFQRPGTYTQVNAGGVVLGDDMVLSLGTQPVACQPSAA